ncbi:hypothetical protein cypCar_00008665, partial [Cyprinus carpio]
ISRDHWHLSVVKQEGKGNPTIGKGSMNWFALLPTQRAVPVIFSARDSGNFTWGSECCTRKTRTIDVLYIASNNELVRTKTLVKSCIVLVDSTLFRQWYEAHYAIPLGHKKGAMLTPEEELLNKKWSMTVQKKTDRRRKKSKISSLLEEQFLQGRLLSCIAPRPGYCGRAGGHILEGKELEFHLRKIRAKKGK